MKKLLLLIVVTGLLMYIPDVAHADNGDNSGAGIFFLILIGIAIYIYFQKKSGSSTSPKPIITKCPRCGSSNFQIITEGQTKGFNKNLGCLAGICSMPFTCLPLGWFCGMSDMGKGQTQARRMCVNCGEKID